MKKLSQDLADQFRNVYLSKDWVSTTSLKAQLENTTFKQATTKISDHNTIATLTFHLNYYVEGIAKVLEGGPLKISDKYSFDAPSILSEEDWEQLKEKLWLNAERFAELISQNPPEYWEQPFANLNYGSNYHNINAMIQHIYYHLGQIVLLKKLIREGAAQPGQSSV